MNDPHKGRDSGAVWKATIDLAAALLLFVSASGLTLLYFLKKYRSAGALLLVTGAVVSYLIVAIWVP